MNKPQHRLLDELLPYLRTIVHGDVLVDYAHNLANQATTKTWLPKDETTMPPILIHAWALGYVSMFTELVAVLGSDYDPSRNPDFERPSASHIQGAINMHLFGGADPNVDRRN